ARLSLRPPASPAVVPAKAGIHKKLGPRFRGGDCGLAGATTGYLFAAVAFFRRRLALAAEREVEDGNEVVVRRARRRIEVLEEDALQNLVIGERRADRRLERVPVDRARATDRPDRRRDSVRRQHFPADLLIRQVLFAPEQRRARRAAG